MHKKVAVDRISGVAIKLNINTNRLQQNLDVLRGVTIHQDDRKAEAQLYLIYILQYKSV